MVYRKSGRIRRGYMDKKVACGIWITSKDVEMVYRKWGKMPRRYMDNKVGC